jgi:hypothetical protein
MQHRRRRVARIDAEANCAPHQEHQKAEHAKGHEPQWKDDNEENQNERQQQNRQNGYCRVCNEWQLRCVAAEDYG